MRNKIILLMLLSIITAFSYQESYEVLAHFEEIDVTYDSCQQEINTDGINEKWYVIHGDNIDDVGHIGDGNGETLNVKIYYNTKPSNGNYIWESEIINEDIVDEIQLSFTESINKWNNVYIYNINSENFLNKKRLVNISIGNSEDYNLIIFPEYDSNILKGVATADFVGNGTPIDNTHKHYEKRSITINPKHYYSENLVTREFYYQRTGAHEFGHVLGLGDIDSNENNNSSNYHHEELIMGYSNNNYLPMQINITYKDIAGAMITMGFHTSSDHKWMHYVDGNKYKLICSICNGVKYSPTIPTGSVIYESCNGNHLISSGNMMAVASYGTKDYYKCKYCRYVAPFELNVEQSYGEREYIDGNTIQHYAHSNNGLTYKVLENHFYDYYTNTFVPYPYNHAQYSLKHKVICGCDGAQTYRAHAFSYQDLNDGNMTTTCLDCGAVIISKTTGPGIIQPMSSNIWKVTDNGSYKLTNGIIILVEEDIDSYKEGTLEFKDANSEIM